MNFSGKPSIFLWKGNYSDSGYKRCFRGQFPGNQRISYEGNHPGRPFTQTVVEHIFKKCLCLTTIVSLGLSFSNRVHSYRFCHKCLFSFYSEIIWGNNYERKKPFCRGNSAIDRRVWRISESGNSSLATDAVTFIATGAANSKFFAFAFFR